MKKIFPFLFFFGDCLTNTPLPRVQVFPIAASVPVSSRRVGAMFHSQRPGPPRERWEGEDEPLGLLPDGAAPGQGRAGGIPPAGPLGRAGLCRFTSTHGRSRAPGSAPNFPPHILLLSVARGAEDKSGPVLPRPHWDQRGLVRCRRIWGLADVRWMAMAPELPHKEAQTSVSTSLESSGSRHMFAGACAGRDVAFFIAVSILNRPCCDWAVADGFGSGK